MVEVEKNLVLHQYENGFEKTTHIELRTKIEVIRHPHLNQIPIIVLRNNNHLIIERVDAGIIQ